MGSGNPPLLSLNKAAWAWLVILKGDAYQESSGPWILVPLQKGKQRSEPASCLLVYVLVCVKHDGIACEISLIVPILQTRKRRFRRGIDFPVSRQPERYRAGIHT